MKKILNLKKKQIKPISNSHLQCFIQYITKFCQYRHQIVSLLKDFCKIIINKLEILF